MSDDKLAITKEFEAVASEVHARFGKLNAEQLNWRPRADAWSVAQCLQHLIITTDEYATDFRGIADGTRRARLWERISPFSGFFGRFLAGALEKDAQKTKTPARFVPPSDLGGDVVLRFMRSQTELVTLIRGTAKADWRRTILTSSFQPIITYSLADAYRIMVVHQHRHIRQADRVTRTEGFPPRVA